MEAGGAGRSKQLKQHTMYDNCREGNRLSHQLSDQLTELQGREADFCGLLELRPVSFISNAGRASEWRWWGGGCRSNTRDSGGVWMAPARQQKHLGKDKRQSPGPTTSRIPVDGRVSSCRLSFSGRTFIMCDDSAVIILMVFINLSQIKDFNFAC